MRMDPSVTKKLCEARNPPGRSFASGCKTLASKPSGKNFHSSHYAWVQEVDSGVDTRRDCVFTTSRLVVKNDAARALFIVAVVLLNVLIAIVSKSHDDITGKIAAGLFYRSRLEYITETTPVARLLPSWLRREEDGDSIKERLREALAQHKDASEADHVRESEERTKQELADVKRELAAMAATQQIILTKLQTILDDKQQP